MCNGVDDYCSYAPATDNFERIGTTSKGTATFDSATDIITLTGHGLNDGDSIKFSGGTLPAELDRRYFYVRESDTNTFKISYFPTGTTIDFTDNGS
jgi:hypothetical protein